MSEEIVNRRNIHALHQAYKAQQETISALVTRLENLERRAAMQETELQAQRQQLVVVLASRGRGPTA